MIPFKKFLIEYGFTIGKHGKISHSYTGTETRELHNDHKGNHLHMTFSREELSLGDVHFHGRMHGNNIDFRSSKPHKVFGEVTPTKQDIHRDLKKAHPNLPTKHHDEIHRIAWGGVKTHIPYEKADKNSELSSMSDEELARQIKAKKSEKKLH